MTIIYTADLKKGKNIIIDNIQSCIYNSESDFYFINGTGFERVIPGSEIKRIAIYAAWPAVPEGGKYDGNL